MKDKNKTKAQLLTELAELRQQVADLQAAAVEREQLETELRDEIATRKLAEVELRRTQTNLQKAEQEKALLLDTTYEMFAYYDTELRIQWANKAAGDSVGLTVQELVGRHCYEIWPQRNDPCPDCPVLQALETGRPQEIEKATPDGRWWFIRGYPVFNQANEIIGLVEFTQNITERKQAEEQLKASLREKEILLKEIHHRVKNNLTVISSLLDFQAEMIDDERLHAAFQVSQNRIYSMARIHEHLYRSDDLLWIDMAEYSQNLANYLQQAYGAYHILLKIDIGDVVLDIDRAIPCGLIINELVSNALKHAFPPPIFPPGGGIEGGQKVNQVCISFSHKNKTQIVLAVSDNGVGLPPDFDWQNTTSLGLRLVKLLNRQIQGTLALDRDGQGTTFSVTFANPRSKEG
jgi:PAS domain S-box-containing protein